MREVKCEFVSVWEDGEVREPAHLDLDTGDVWKDRAGDSGEGLGRLLREYVSFGDSDTYTVEVCGVCHDHVVGPLSEEGSLEGTWDFSGDPEENGDFPEESWEYGERYGCPLCDGGELARGWLDGLLGGVTPESR